MNQQFLQTKDGQNLQIRFLELRKKLSALEWITHGSVTPNHPGNWKWTTKVKAKTVTLSLTQEQADLFKEAIAANREAESILKEMRSISQEILLKSTPGTRKKSSRKIIPNGS
jgi:predicted DNA-binding helix-hairpin-helix protein